jgi:hypothetical protein
MRRTRSSCRVLSRGRFDPRPTTETAPHVALEAPETGLPRVRGRACLATKRDRCTRPGPSLAGRAGRGRPGAVSRHRPAARVGHPDRHPYERRRKRDAADRPVEHGARGRLGRDCGGAGGAVSAAAAPVDGALAPAPRDAETRTVTRRGSTTIVVVNPRLTTSARDARPGAPLRLESLRERVPRLDGQLAIDVRQMCLDGPQADEETLSDLAVRHPFGRHPRHP